MLAGVASRHCLPHGGVQTQSKQTILGDQQLGPALSRDVTPLLTNQERTPLYSRPTLACQALYRLFLKVVIVTVFNHPLKDHCSTVQNASSGAAVPRRHPESSWVRGCSSAFPRGSRRMGRQRGACRAQVSTKGMMMEFEMMKDSTGNTLFLYSDHDPDFSCSC